MDRKDGWPGRHLRQGAGIDITVGKGGFRWRKRAEDRKSEPRVPKNSETILKWGVGDNISVKITVYLRN